MKKGNGSKLIVTAGQKLQESVDDKLSDLYESVKKYVTDNLSAIKQQITASYQQQIEKVERAEVDASLAKNYSILNARLLFDLATGREIRFVESEKWGKTVDRQYYVKQLQAAEDTDAFIAGQVSTPEEIEKSQSDATKQSMIEDVVLIIGKLILLNKETRMRQLKRDEKLVEYLKTQELGIEWLDGMEDVVEEAWDKHSEILTSARRLMLEDAVKHLFVQNPNQLVDDEDFVDKVKSFFLLRAENPLLWRDEMKDWITAAVEDMQNTIKDNNKELVKKAYEHVEKHPDLKEKADELKVFADCGDFREVSIRYGELSGIASKRDHEARLDGEGVIN